MLIEWSSSAAVYESVMPTSTEFFTRSSNRHAPMAGWTCTGSLPPCTHVRCLPEVLIRSPEMTALSRAMQNGFDALLAVPRR